MDLGVLNSSSGSYLANAYSRLSEKAGEKRPLGLEYKALELGKFKSCSPHRWGGGRLEGWKARLDVQGIRVGVSQSSGPV